MIRRPKRQPICIENENAMQLPSVEESKRMSVLQIMDWLSGCAEDSGLTDEFFAEVEPLAAELGGRLDLTAKQAVLYSMFVENYDDMHIGIERLHRHTGASMIRLVQLQDEIDALERHRYIRRTKRHTTSSLCYCVPQPSIQALRENKPYVPPKMTHLSFVKFMQGLDTRLRLTTELNGPLELTMEELTELVECNMHLKIAQQLKESMNVLDDDDWFLLVVICVIESLYSQEFMLSNLCNMYGEMRSEFIDILIKDGNHTLQQMGLVEYGNCDGMADPNSLTLTKKAKKQFLSEDNRVGGNDDEQVMSYKDIRQKSLFYDASVKEQVDRLSGLLSHKTFGNVCKRLSKRGMREGFACLFYGAPGTGKTETVMQLARQTGRNIMQVDFSQIRDKWVGESEKNVKAIFDEYKALCLCERWTPILLLNEADALIGKRLQKVEHSVDTMNNTMQNIILQEMERFEGILIATTNLEGNMDSAFERRFLYKIRFEKPSPAVRKQIWQSIIPELDDETALRLAKEHDFSGGQIENVARKQVVDSILYGESSDTYATLMQYCKDEKLQNRNARPCVGFAI